MARDLRIATASLSDVGATRSENQDFWGEFEREGERLLILADGMGGHRGGATASRLCVESVARVFKEARGPAEARLRMGLERANEEINAAARRSHALKGMGTTAVALLVAGERAWVAWIGDSRAYRRRGDSLEALTQDHSLVAEWVRGGILSAAEGENHPRRNELTRAIGSASSVEPDLVEIDIAPGDTLLLCSDGLWGVVEHTEVGAILDAMDPHSAARALVDAANANGGPDNVTVQILSVSGQSENHADTAPCEPARKTGWRALRLAVPRLHVSSALAGAALAALLASVGFVLASLHDQEAEPQPEPQALLPWETPGEMLPARRSPTQAEDETLRRLEGVLAGGVVLLESLAEPAESGETELAPHAQETPPGPEPEGVVRSVPETAPLPDAGEVEPAPAPPASSLIEGPPRPRAEDEVLTADAYGLEPRVERFVNDWLEAVVTANYALYSDLGFRESTSEFYRTYGTRDGFRLLNAEVVDVRTRPPVRIYLRLVLSYVFEDGSGRFRTEDTLRLILQEGPDGLRFAGSWQ